MRIALALATVLTGSVFGIAGIAAPAHATTCTPPSVSGLVVTSLTAHGISCNDAQHLAGHTIRQGTAPHGYACTQRISGRHVSYSCHTTNGSGHNFHVGYHVQ